MDEGIKKLLKEAKEVASRLRAHLVAELEQARTELQDLLSVYEELGIEPPERETVLATITNLDQVLADRQPLSTPSSQPVVELAPPQTDGEPSQDAAETREPEPEHEAVAEEPAQRDGEAAPAPPAPPTPAAVTEPTVEEVSVEETQAAPKQQGAEPKPERVHAAPKKRRPPLSPAKFRELLNAWMKETKPLPDKQKAEPHELLHWKHLACQGRVLVLAAKELEEDDDLIWGELHHITNALKRVAGEKGEFFAFNRFRDYPYNQWYDLARAFEGATAVARFATLLKECADLFKESERQRIMTACRAATDWILSRVYEVAKVYDRSVTDLDKRIKAIEEMLGAGAQVTRERTPQGQKRQVTWVIENVADWEKTCADRRLKRKAVVELGEAVGTDDPVQMVEALYRARERGVPPSDPQLLDTAERARDLGAKILDEEVIRYLEKRDESAREKQSPKMEEISRERADGTEKLLPHTRGKTVFILSGKTKAEHAAKLKEELELAEVLWPDVEKDTKVSSLRKYVKKCDIMVFNPNFSRHRYKELQDMAEGAGKPCVVLNHGYGVDQIISRMHEEFEKRGFYAT